MRRIAIVSCILLFAFATGARANLIFGGTLTGTQEVPPNLSTATGSVLLDIDTLLHQLTVNLSWSGLIGGAPVAAHIHCCTAPGTNVNVAVGFPGFPAATSGTYQQTFDLTNAATYGASFLTNFGGGTAAGAEAALIAGLAAGMAYVNIHNATFPGGEIRAQVAAAPEPVTLALTALGIGILAMARRRQLPR